MFNLFKKKNKAVALKGKNPPVGKKNPNYGLSTSTPVCVSGGPAEGAQNEKHYLSRLRCPDGKPITFNRRGSVNPESEKLMVEMKESMKTGKKTPEKDPAELFSRIFGKSLDLYDVQCTCGKKHSALIYINMYEEGPDDPIDLAGWTLEDD